MSISISTGIGLAFVAMLGWGVGDFLLQRSTRKIGDWETLLAVSGFSTVILFPFVFREVPALFSDSETLLVVLLCAVSLLVAGLLYFEGIRRGKISVTEPMQSLEVLSAALLAFWILGDRLSGVQVALLVALIAGLMLVSFKEGHSLRHLFLEKGIYFAIGGGFLMGFGDFFLGWSSRLNDPLLALFAVDLLIAVVAALYLAAHGALSKTIKDIFTSGFLLVASISETTAWIAYAFAMSIIPIAIATGISESSIIVAVLLGFLINHERIQRHQKFGLVLAVVLAIALAALTA